MSKPVITRVRVKSDSGSDPRGYERWVAIFGAGYGANGWGDPHHPNYRWDDANTDDTYRYGRGIYMVDITTGEILAFKRWDGGTGSSPPPGPGSPPGPPDPGTTTDPVNPPSASGPVAVNNHTMASPV
jgi:hypothetical protein